MFPALQNTAAGNGVDANPKVGDISYIRDRYFQSVYDQANTAMTATSPMSTLRGRSLGPCVLRHVGMMGLVVCHHLCDGTLMQLPLVVKV